jgi:hypothetical protein
VFVSDTARVTLDRGVLIAIRLPKTTGGNA